MIEDFVLLNNLSLGGDVAVALRLPETERAPRRGVNVGNGGVNFWIQGVNKLIAPIF